MWRSIVSTYLPFESYRNYSVSNHSVLHLWVVFYFSVQPLSFSLFVLNQPKTVKPQIYIYRFYLLTLLLRSPYQSLFWYP